MPQVKIKPIAYLLQAIIKIYLFDPELSPISFIIASPSCFFAFREWSVAMRWWSVILRGRGTTHHRRGEADHRLGKPAHPRFSIQYSPGTPAHRRGTAHHRLFLPDHASELIKEQRFAAKWVINGLLLILLTAIRNLVRREYRHRYHYMSVRMVVFAY